jgi:HEAT repeat protein
MSHRTPAPLLALFVGISLIPAAAVLADDDDDILNPPNQVQHDKKTARLNFLKAELLTGDSFKLRLQAANILGQLNDLRAVPPLINALGDEHFAVRGQAAIGLGALGDPASAPELINVLKNDDEAWVRKEAAKALGKVRHEKTAPALVEALKDKRWKVRLAAATSLGNVGGAEAVNALVMVLDNALEAKEVRDAALASLTQLREHIDAGTQVMTLKRDPDRVKRSRAARLLGVIAGPLAVDALLDGLKDEEIAVRLTVIETLEKLGDPKAVGPLESLLRHEQDQLVARRARNCLKMLKRD